MATLVGLVAAQNAFAQSSGKVKFNGELVNSTCSINAGDEDKTVTLPTVSTTAFSSANKTAGSTAFTIGVTQCSADLNTVKAHFEMDNMDPVTRNLKNLATTNPAANVNVQLVDGDGGTPVLLGSAGKPVTLAGTGAARGATLTYGGQYYVADPATISAGKVESFTRFTLAYD
ncbi:fimbrial protein [Cupriavidus ulmosensis]